MLYGAGENRGVFASKECQDKLQPPSIFFLAIHSLPEQLVSVRIQDERGIVDRFLRIQINSSATKSEPAVVSFLLTVYFKRLKPLISLLRI